MKKIVWFSDIHLGLKTSEIDRSEEIVDVSLQPIKHAVKLKNKGHDVTIVIGGDVFEHNHPSDELISHFITIINPAVKAGIKIYVLVGNHDSVSNPKRKSCFTFLKKLKGNYSKVKVIDDIISIKFSEGILGEGCYLTFFPHITKVHLKGTKYKTTQAYIDGKAKKIWKTLGKGVSQIVGSHLNVRDLIRGSEENLLKKSEVWFPDSFMESNLEQGYNIPLIMQGHIHCLDEKTEVLTDSGWRYYDKLNYNDKVLTRNLGSGDDEFVHPDDIIISDYKGKMVEIKNNVSNHLVTPNHKICYMPASKNSYRLESIDEINNEVLQIPCVSNISGVGTGIDLCLIRLLVWVCADGYVDYKNNEITFHFKKRRKVRTITNLMDGMYIDYKEYRNEDKTVKIKILNKGKTAEFLFSEFRGGKELPRWFRNANKLEAETILKTYAITDGNYQKHNRNWIQLGSVKEREVDLLQELFVRNGISAKKNHKEINTPNNKYYYYLSVNLNRDSVGVRKSRNINSVKYKGKVWCLSVKNSNFMVRREGTVYFTGNSKQRKENMHVGGSPIFCGFGEKEKHKYFAVINVPTKMGEKQKVIYKKVKCRPFIEIELKIKKGKIIKPKIDIPKNAVLKINVSVPEDEAFKYDWEDIREQYQKKCFFVKPIDPHRIRKNFTRNSKQTINLSPSKATKVWLKENKPKDWKRKLALAQDYIEAVL